MIKDKVIQFLAKYNLLNPESTLMVAFSGGADSLCLLDILYKISPEYNFNLVAAHLNHNWRGLESKLEEERARDYCIKRNITFYSETLPENLPHTELEARNQRYAFFNRTAEKFKVTAILTGHTLTDQVETVLYRIIKGTGTIGLKGIPEVRYQDDKPPIYRPMLDITREQILKYCEENNLTPNVDTSNFNEQYLRNRIRLSLIPELKTYNSNIEMAVLKLSQISGDAEKLINEYLGKIKDKIYKDNQEIKTNKFINLSMAAKRRIILDYLLKNNIEYDFEKISELIEFINASAALKSGNTYSLTKDKWLFTSSKIIKLVSSIKSDMIKSSVKVNICPDCKTYHPELDKTIIISLWTGDRPDKFPDEKSDTIYVDLSGINEPVYLRTRQPGDRIQPFGMQSKTKLKKYLINKGIPEFERDNIPLLATDSEILWAVGIGISELLRVKDIPTHVIKVE